MHASTQLEGEGHERGPTTFCITTIISIIQFAAGNYAHSRHHITIYFVTID